MDSIRRALGEEKISYFGFSYGSELGATWATLFPDTVRAAVLDGAADPTAGYIESGLQQSVGFESSLATFLQQCSDDPSCEFHNDGNAEQAFDQLMTALDEQPVPSSEGRPDVNLQVAISGVFQAMYSDQLWQQLAQALKDAQGGNGAGLLQLYDDYYARNEDGTYDNSLEAFQTIFCMDTTERLTVAEEDAAVPQFQAAARRLSPGTTGSYFCTFYPETQDPRVDITGAGAGPILVMGTTGDPSTPLDNAADGRLVGGRPVGDRHRQPAHRLRRQRVLQRHHRAVPGRPGGQRAHRRGGVPVGASPHQCPERKQPEPLAGSGCSRPLAGSAGGRGGI